MKAALIVVLAVAGCPNPQPAPTPGATCPAVRASGTAADGTELVCDDAGRWRERYVTGGSR